MAENIDLDIEFRRMVDEYGWWMVLRSFNLSKKSKYWQEMSNEAVGGPQWEYNDIIFKGRRVEMVQGDVETYETRQQLTNVYTDAFFVISKIIPKKEDVIIEIPSPIRFLPRAPKNIKAFEIFDIKHVEYKIDRGIAFSKCYSVKQTPSNDETLKGSIPVTYIPAL